MPWLGPAAVPKTWNCNPSSFYKVFGLFLSLRAGFMVSGDEHDFMSSRIREALSSRDRRVVLRTFQNRPNIWLTQREVCTLARLPLSQVLGVMRGSQGRYNPDLSLINLGLIEEKEVQVSAKRNRKLYKFSVKSQSTLESIDHILKRRELEGEP